MRAALTTHLCAVAAQLVGPGALVPGGGPGAGGRRRGGWGVVDEWPKGFFIGGSAIDEMNGLYRTPASKTRQLVAATLGRGRVAATTR